jgi:Tfp pilus assembly protein PilV
MARAHRETKPEHDRDAGFGLLEALVALFVLALVLVGVERGAIATIQASAFNRQHVVATGIVTEALAQAETLPFTSLEEGIDSAVGPPLSSDPNVETVTGPSGTSYVYRGNGQVISTSGTDASEAPFAPYATTVTNGIDYDVSTYPTTTASAPGVVTVTVVVTWRTFSGATGRVSGETRIAAP